MSKINIKELQLSRKNLTDRYKTKHRTDLLNPTERNVYVQSRMPATQAVCEKVFSQIKKNVNITSILDLWCGSGSATYAALKIFPSLSTIHLIDQHNYYEYDFSQPYQFFKQNFKDLNFSQSYDLIVASYAINECDDKLVENLLHYAWKYTNKYLVVIEPGTPHGYSAFLKARQHLIDQGAFLMAPCPHECACPLVHPDWCHFKIRLHRTKIHQQIKQGTKSFEDESYIFGIFSKHQEQKTINRIIKKPIKKSGHILFNLCTPDGLENETVSRKDKIRYVKAKRLEWGDEF